MLLNSFRDRYQKFLLAIQHYQNLLNSYSSISQSPENQQTAATSSDKIKLKQGFAQLQAVFTEEIANLSLDDLEPAIASRLQSYLTEINKQLQLLGIDVTFLQASRQRATAQTKITQISTRLQTITNYCQAILDLGF
ncbi:heterocyst frequency control protein PatD [Phormidium sp. LEGE 05292]|uniref:heterocyst frequency control protein PatD n=1 Tax=[Phormidium] sp. LEGE 05292 TaxID=767427 RepID=UPI00187E7107|nr:heterocyst frequency control protein PatD [Phormidium sp. LEGE 05292]MBE9229711.1 heterocyst frequency control protein PatD [Phormidium sp. LEGE 05292]